MEAGDSRAGRVLVIGLGTTGVAVTRHLLSSGKEVVAVDDAPSSATRSLATSLGVDLVERPDPAALARLADGFDLVVVSPGVPAHHAVFGLPVELTGELELAWSASPRPIVAITGTNGKTTVTTLVTRMLQASGKKAVAAGNIGLPLIEAIGADAEVIVVEASSFQLALTLHFRPAVAVWLNVAEDHLDWHPSMDHYVASKERIWLNQRSGDVAVANAEDPIVSRRVLSAPVPPVTFGVDAGDYRVVDGQLLTDRREVILGIDELRRGLPHDVSNALAASAAALAAGATLEGVREALLHFEGLPHRVELVGEAGGVRFYDDSKATTPASVLAALAGFDSVVLIAGGRNKGLRLRDLRMAAPRVKAVVAIGEAATEIEGAFSDLRPVVTAASMDDAVSEAASIAQPGDTVLLSPGCTSFDWYHSYAERGADFSRAVQERSREGQPR
jgi:UDP-N-acetylmuramoylalanine--D-glutamate ligase